MALRQEALKDVAAALKKHADLFPGGYGVLDSETSVRSVTLYLWGKNPLMQDFKSAQECCRRLNLAFREHKIATRIIRRRENVRKKINNSRSLLRHCIPWCEPGVFGMRLTIPLLREEAVERLTQ